MAVRPRVDNIVIAWKDRTSKYSVSILPSEKDVIGEKVLFESCEIRRKKDFSTLFRTRLQTIEVPKMLQLRLGVVFFMSISLV